MKERLYTVIRSALVSEKSTRLTQLEQTYTFWVLVSANKKEIKEAIESLFEVKVEAVTTVKNKGKVKRFRGRLGQRVSTKKAYVKLSEGQTIDLQQLQ